MASKHKITGRIAGVGPNSMVYWKCPTRGCTDVHYFPYHRVDSSGMQPVFEQVCGTCLTSYTATQLNCTASSAILVAVVK